MRLRQRRWRFPDLTEEHRHKVLDRGLHLVPLTSTLARNESLETLGEALPQIYKNTVCVDFSGWIVYTLADSPTRS